MDALNFKPKVKTPFDRLKNNWTDEANQNFRLMELDNLEELANDIEE